ncbi:hypothetical protein DVH24_010461 [Malus domestica]|uniref:Uncharacterized protein n=1 Tax=Malus domestica TaxID=3750 RepID=A0A498JSV4_MALDO|nr:hypothetical protein DVH24_010461 [Malus domestica]
MAYTLQTLGIISRVAGIKPRWLFLHPSLVDYSRTFPSHPLTRIGVLRLCMVVGNGDWVVE